MTVGEIIELLKEMDLDEEASFHLVTHSDMHIAAHAAGIEVDCQQVDRALTIYTAMHHHKIGMDPHLIFKALGRADLDHIDEDPEEVSKPVIH